MSGSTSLFRSPPPPRPPTSALARARRALRRGGGAARGRLRFGLLRPRHSRRQRIAGARAGRRERRQPRGAIRFPTFQARRLRRAPSPRFRRLSGRGSRAGSFRRRPARFRRPRSSTAKATSRASRRSPGRERPGRRLALEWAALRADPHPTFAALAAFADAHPTWPGRGSLRDRQEATSAFIRRRRPRSPSSSPAARRSRARARSPPRARRSLGRVDEAIATIRALVARRQFRRPGPRRRSCATSALRSSRPITNIAPTACSMPGTGRRRARRGARRPGRDSRSPQARIAAAHGPLTAALVKAVPPALATIPASFRPGPGRAARRPHLRGGDAARPRADAIATR